MLHQLPGFNPKEVYLIDPAKIQLVRIRRAKYSKYTTPKKIKRVAYYRWIVTIVAGEDWHTAKFKTEEAAMEAIEQIRELANGPQKPRSVTKQMAINLLTNELRKLGCDVEHRTDDGLNPLSNTLNEVPSNLGK